MLHTVKVKMANQRKKSKVHVGGYYERELKDQLVKRAQAEDVSVTRVLERIIRKFCRQLN